MSYCILTQPEQCQLVTFYLSQCYLGNFATDQDEIEVTAGKATIYMHPSEFEQGVIALWIGVEGYWSMRDGDVLRSHGYGSPL